METSTAISRSRCRRNRYRATTSGRTISASTIQPVAGHMGYNWRQTFWYEPEKAIYGVHGNSGYLFRFLPPTGRSRCSTASPPKIPSAAACSTSSATAISASRLDADDRTIYYLTGGPIYDKRPPREGQGLHRQGRVQRAAKTCTSSRGTFRLATLHRPRCDLLRERPAPELRQLHRRRQGRFRLRAVPRL